MKLLDAMKLFPPLIFSAIAGAVVGALLPFSVLHLSGQAKEEPVAPTVYLAPTAEKNMLVITHVNNGRIYHEEAAYVIEYPDTASCTTAAAAYPWQGTDFYKALCVAKAPIPK